MNPAAELTPVQKRDLLKHLLQNGREPVHLSEAQARLWQLESHASPSGVHDFSLAYSLAGALDADLLEQALRAVAGCHPSLRVRIVEKDDRAVFEHVDLPPVLLERVDCGADLEERLSAEAACPLNPAIGLGWHATLYRLSANQHTLLLHFHHILADRWSVGIFVSDLAVAYQALQQGREPLSVPATAQWKLKTVGGEDIQGAMSYWRELFAPPVDELRLPLARQSEFAGYAGGRIESELDPATTDALKQQAAAQAVTLFPMLLAAFAAFLREHTGQEDLVICTPITGRQRAATRGSIGYFNNILPLRISLAGDPEFGKLATDVAALARSAANHQDVPFHRICGLPQLAGHRIARCLFTMQNIPGLQLNLPEVASSYRDVFNGKANFDLSLFAEEEHGRIRLLLDYKTAVLEHPAATELSRQFGDFVRRVARQPMLRLSNLPHYRSHEQPSQPPSPHARVESDRLNLLQQKMIALWREAFPELDASTIGADTRFFSIGGDSLRAARLFALIRKEFSLDLPLATLFEAATPLELVNRISDQDWVAPWLSLIPVKSRGERPPLFCVHGGGGNVIAFQFLAECLDEDQPLYCLQAKGLHPDEEPYETVEQTAAHYVESVRQLRPHGPYQITGHSLGAAVAYEMAQLLVRAGEQVSFLGLLDHPGPDIRLSKLDWLKYQMTAVSMFSPKEYIEYVWHGLRWRLRARTAQRRIAAANGAAVPSSSVDMVEQAFRALRAYQIQPYPGRICLFRAQKGPAKIRSDRYGGWGSVAGDGVDVFEVPGTHMSMLEQPHVEHLAKAISRCLAGPENECVDISTSAETVRGWPREALGTPTAEAAAADMAVAADIPAASLRVEHN